MVDIIDFTKAMKSINEYFFVSFLSESYLATCETEIKPYINSKGVSSLQSGYKPTDLENSCFNMIDGECIERNDKGTLLYNQVLLAREKANEVFGCSDSDLNLKISTQYAISHPRVQNWHKDSPESAKLTDCNSDQSMFALSVEIFGGAPTTFVKTGQENFTPVEKYKFTPPTKDKYTTDQALSGEAAIFTSNAIHSSPYISFPEDKRLTLIFYGAIKTKDFKYLPYINSNTIEHMPKDHNLLTIMNSDEAPKAQTTPNQFLLGYLASKVMVAPILGYTSNIIEDNNNQNLIEYFQQHSSEIIYSLSQVVCFSILSFINPMPKVYGQTNIQIVNKISSDIVFNLITFQANKIYDMLSADYAKELSFFVLPSLHSMLGGNNIIDINQIIEDHPFASGMLTGAGAEIIDLAGVLGNKAYDLVYPDDSISE